MRKKHIVFLIGIFSLTTLYGFSPDMIPDPFFSPYQKQDEKQVVEQMQAMLLEQIFTRPMLQTQELFVVDDDDPGMMSLQQEQAWIQEILAREMAKSLAKQDILKLNKIIEGNQY